MARLEAGHSRIVRAGSALSALVIFLTGWGAVDGATQPAEAAGPGCGWCHDPPPPDPQPGPDGGSSGFSDETVLIGHYGGVVDSGGESCEGCVWRTAPMCVNEGGLCQESVRCGPGDKGVLHTVYLTRPGEGEESVGALCLRPGADPVTKDDVWREVRSQWTVWVPEQRISMQPPEGETIVNLPTYFHSGQPQQMPPETVPVFDFEVTLTARGEWEWRFEPGVTRTFDVPGSYYDDPNPEVRYTYQSTGDRDVVLETRWWGSFSVSDHGPYDIEEPATQTSDPIALDVRQAGSVLTN